MTKELQADCFAGAWAKHAQDDEVINVSSADLDLALAGISELRDTPRPLQHRPERARQRIRPRRRLPGRHDNGLSRCKDYRDDEPMVLELPFNDAEDEARGGQSAEGYVLFYCVDDDYVGWDNVGAMPEVYKRGGDYAVATLLATQYGLAALTRLGDQSDEKTSTLRGDCLRAGNRERHHLQPAGRQHVGVPRRRHRAAGRCFEQVRASREGVMNGAESCVGYQGWNTA